MTRILGEIARFCKGRRWTTATLGSNSTRQPSVRRRPAEGDLLVVEEEVLVHPAQHVEQPGVDEHAGTRDPGDRPGADPPIGLVFPARARYQLLPERSGPGWGRRRRRAGATRRGCGGRIRRSPGCRSGSASNRSTRATIAPSQPFGDDDVGIEHQEPAALRGAPAGVDAGGEPAVLGPGDQPDARPAASESSAGIGSLRGVIDDHDLADPRRDLGASRPAPRPAGGRRASCCS